MKSHHLGLLIAAATLTLLAGFWVSRMSEPAVDGIGAPLLPGLAEAVNDVTGVKLVGPGNKTIATLSRDDEAWRLAERAGHRANVPMVRELLLKLARARLLEEKTSNSEYYSRLAVEDIDSEQAGGVLVQIDGIDVPAIIIGNSENAREAVYARRADEATTWLASGNIDITTDVVQWLGKNVIDINVNRIAKIEINHPDGTTVVASKSEFGQPNFVVASIPGGRELKRPNMANAIASVIDGLEVNDVLPLADSGFAELPATRATFRAFDGFVLYADLASKDEQYYVRFSAATDAAIASRYLPADAATDEDDLSAGPVPTSRNKPDLSVVTEEAEQLNKSLADWVYLLPKSKYDQMTRRMPDLLKDPA